jgi:hypothetical protein
MSGGRIILVSRFVKAWTAATPKSTTHAEFPGTAVLWDDEYYEVLTADALGSGGVRYTLAPWREEHTIRTFVSYDPASEARLKADYDLAARQRKHSRLASLFGIVLGHLPGHVQERLGNELGVRPTRMTIVSTIPSIVLLGVCVWLYVTQMMDSSPRVVPAWLWFIALFMTADSAVRFQTAMSQPRGVGSVPGTILHSIYALLTGKKVEVIAKSKLPLQVDPETALRDSIEVRSWMLTLIPAREQLQLAERYGLNYRKHAFDVAWAILACGAVGATAMYPRIGLRVSALASFLVAMFVALEQAYRLLALRRGPIGSTWGFLVRPFMRDLLERK